MTGVDALSRETMLFAAVGFLIGGVDDLALDLLYLAHRGGLWRRAAAAARPTGLDDFPLLPDPGRIVLFVPAWEEAAVIGPMLRTALANIDHPNYRIYVGTYPNDPATIAAVAAVEAEDGRVRLVIGPRAGPTTKADCLNALWSALQRDEAAGERRAKAVMLHDAEDVVHRGELRIVDTLIEHHWAVQIPVLPLRAPGSRLVSGHYCDEFAEAHAKQLVVRELLGAGLPLAGVGCALARDAIEALAQASEAGPFDAESLVEDYEVGLRISAMGKRATVARVHDEAGRPVAVRAYFPARLEAAVRQKTRWMIGIALSGWDRIGWGRRFDWGDHWMRMRDRRAPIAVIILATAYLALLCWAASMLLHLIGGTTAAAPGPAVTLVLTANAVLLAWRLAMRALFTGRAYGWGEAPWSLPRAFVGNLIALLAARRAVTRYIGMLRGAPLRWDKTVHIFPQANDHG